MKAKKLFILCVALIFQHVATAQSVSKELATRTAIQYAKYSRCQTAPKVLMSLRGDFQRDADTTITRAISFTGKALLYLVEPEDGWVLVSSELITTPILASAPTGRFPDYENMPDGMKWLMSYYEDVIQYARDSASNNRANGMWSSYTPNLFLQRETIDSIVLSRMAQVHWNQNDNNDGYANDCSKTYNKFCPVGVYPKNHCGHQYVGCDAVAIGQVMWYYQWPHSALIPNSPNSVNGEKHLVKYDWNTIPTDIYDNSDMSYVNSVASFLRDCGYANNMQYGDSGSSSNLGNDLRALTKTFHYNRDIERKYRIGTDNWIRKLKDEIKAGRPIIYRGQGNTGGHAFVLFGYDPDDKFFVNWGWGGGSENNTSYSLDLLRPTNDNGTYNDGQAALFYVEPDYPDCNTYNLTNNDIHDDLFEVYNGGPITAQNKTIQYYQSGVIYSGQSITILPPFTIERGANVHLAIKPPFCDLTQMNAPRNMYVSSNDDCVTGTDVSISCNDGFAISPNPVNAILHIQTTEKLAQVKIYNLNGQCVMQVVQTDIDVSALPQGMYILRAVTTDGIPLQAKFIKQ